MEQENHNRGDDENIPEIPDDISGLVESIQDQDRQRRKAVEINLENARKAKTPEERGYWMRQAMIFADIADEYRGMYPELFSDGGPQAPQDN